MSPENAKERMATGKKVIIVDDDISWADIIKESCEQFGHQVAGMAHSLEEAKKLIRKIQEDGVTIDLALLDGNLNKYSSDGYDGEYLAGIVRKQFPHATVISISRNKQDWSDRPNISANDLEELFEAIKNI